LFYRENCADMALDADAIREDFIAQCRALLITGTHLSTPTVRAASAAALGFARTHGVVRVLDIDYRPVLWGLTKRGAGENGFGAGDAFAAGLMMGFLSGKDFVDAARLANACGAIVVSRHACAPAMPTPAELDRWFSASRHAKVDADAQLAHLHRTTAARPAWPELNVLAFDHRSQFA